MAEIHPNDIGLATFADVGDVEKLKTSAKNLVDALNEIYQNGTQGGNFGEQMYVDGENNIILGENNIVYGSNNLIIGSDNIIVGDGVNIIAAGKSIYNEAEVSFEGYDAETRQVGYYPHINDAALPVKTGDKVAIKVNQTWVNEDWTDWLDITSPLCVAEVEEIDTANRYIKISDIGVSMSPPDETHTVLDYQGVSICIPLVDAYKELPGKSNISFGGKALGTTSFAAGSSTASGNNSFSANTASASANGSAAFCGGKAKSSFSFAANYAEANGEKSAAFNDSKAYTSCALSAGTRSKVYGRPLKCTELNWNERTLTIDSRYSLIGIKKDSIIIVRSYNCINTILYETVKVKSVSGNIIYMADDTNPVGSGDYIPQLFPDGIIFVRDSSTSYAEASMAGGIHGMATGRYSFAYGYQVIAANDGAVIFGKYGINDERCSLALANGTAIKTPGLAFKVLSDGSVHADKEYTSPCADYAEYFEWADGNQNNEDRAGYFVKLKDGKIVLCEDFDTPLGIVSATPAIIGDSGEMHWQGKYVTDDFGRIQYHDVTVPAEIDEDGNTVTEEHIETQPILNPDWNPEQEYIPRKDRPEWSAVGVLGKLIVYDDGTLQSGDICRCGTNGKAAKSVNNGYTVLKRIADDKVLIWFKG